MIKFFLINLTIITLIKADCEIGCLRCSKTDRCEICDFRKFFVKINGRCELKNVDNCEIMDYLGNCVQCKNNFMPNKESKNCISVVRTVPNCEKYNSDSNCNKCKKDFYLKDNSCIQVGSPITNCFIYKNNEECLKCEDNFVLEKNGKICLLGEGDKYCHIYSRVKCDKCEKDYIINYGVESNMFFRFANEAQINKIQEYMLSFYFDNKSYNFPQACEKVEVANCLAVKTAKTCYFCDLTYFLTDQEICERFPIPKTNFCLSYNPIYECVECENGYYLADKNCKANDPIENCILYNGKASRSECTACSGDYYVAAGKCEKRINSNNIQNCLENEVFFDKCGKCADGYVLSGDAIRCFNKISNCLEYANNSSTSAEITCKKCERRYFLKNTKLCELGQLSNCVQYNNETSCNQCESGYYVFNGKCEKHDSISECEEYSQNEKNICNKCSLNYFHFKFLSSCESGVEIAKCKTYFGDQRDKCVECEDGYEIKNDKCEIISLENCLSIQNMMCTSCSRGFALDLKNNSLPTCSPLTDTIVTNCKESSLSQIKNETTILESYCKFCEKNTIPIDHREQFMCVKNSELYVYGISEEYVISYCLKYDINRKCIQCESPRFLSSSGQCVEKCNDTSEGTFYRLQIGASSSNNFVIKAYNICDENQSDVYCNIAAPSPDNSYICIKCLTGFIDVIVIDNSNQYSLVDPFQKELPYIISPIAKHPEVSCVKIDDTNVNSINGDPSKNFVSNCLYYLETGKSGSGTSTKYDYGCIKCKSGFSGTVNAKGYIELCLEMSSCAAEIRYGLDPIWEKLASCHKCSDNENIPFIALKSKSATNPTPDKFLPYKLTALNWVQTPDSANNNIQCLQPVSSSFGYPVENTNFQIPENCGLGVINLSSTDGNSTGNKVENPEVNLTNLGIYCGACKPMYRADPISFIYEFVKVRCTPIENCLRSSWFNGCSECQAGFVYEWKEDKIDYAKCVPNSVENCYAALFLSIDNSICRACKRGYNLNPDFVCEQIIPPNCESGLNFNLKSNYFAHPFYSYYHNQRGLGCEKCTTGYTAIEVSALSKNTFICTKSNYLEQSGNNLPENTNFIPKCEFYSIENNLLHCSQCMIGYLMIEVNAKKKCVLAPDNCLEMSNQTQCKKCAAGFALVKDVCEKGMIQKCLIYKQTNQSVQICEKCEKENYLSLDGNCELGMIMNCEVLANLLPNKCEKCLDGFFLVKKPKLDYCYPQNSLQCQEVSITSSVKYGGEIQCKTCLKPNQILNKMPAQKSTCLNFFQVENCKEYDKNTTLDESTFLCKKCQDEYYLDYKVQVCRRREYSDANCVEYFPIIDKCQKCAENTLLTYKGECESLPSGITDCIQYKNASQCLMCNKNKYLENNKCLDVRADLMIPNCQFYLSAGECKTCEKNYFLSSNECLLASAKNCKTYTDIATCKECEKGKGLLLDSKGNLNCEVVSKSNCVEFSQSDGFPCQICAKNYFPDSNGDCKSVAKIIEGCQQYQEETLCSVCEKDRALSPDKTKCDLVLSLTNEFDRNCSVYYNKPKCAICRPGAFYQINQCVLCENSDGCFRCDPEKPDFCEICQTGYYMKTSGNCIKIKNNSIFNNVDLIAHSSIILFMFTFQILIFF